MSKSATSFVLAYHGCSAKIGRKVLRNGAPLKPSDKTYDWLDPGVYFWEGDAQRAQEWAKEKANKGDYDDPFVIGAVIDLGDCFDLLVRENIDLLSETYKNMKKLHNWLGVETPVNKDPRSVNKGDKLLRFLDCAVIRHLHEIVENQELEPFDTVRGLFVEGNRAYPGGEFYPKSHV